MQILRSILAVVAGFIVAMAVIMGIQTISGKLYPLPEGVDPIWHIDKNAPVAVRFVSAPSVDM